MRFVLNWIEITDSMDVDRIGEFRFLFRVRSDRRGVLRDTALPEEGTLSISERAGENRLGPLDLILFEGDVERGESLTVEVTGEEVDLVTRNDPVDWYERTFAGEPEDWLGTYTPWDESELGQDPEARDQWRLGYTIEAVPDHPSSSPASTATGSGTAARENRSR